MRKITLSLILVSLLAVPTIASAQVLESCTIDNVARVEGDTDLDCDSPCVFAANDDCGMCCLVNTLYNVTDWFFMAFVALAGIMVIIGAFNIVTAGGDSEKVGTGRNYIIYAAVGLAVGLLARAIPGIVKAIVGG